SQFEYGLAISSIISTSLRKLEACRNECFRRLFDESSCSLFKVMLHLVNQPLMHERAAILQTSYKPQSQDSLLKPHL
ncbi:MAG: hypothetical protein EXX96DRAFT_460646, partial [Benjaminiella poitrasii]